ncbi:MAG TPA: hypothetical protein VFB99_10055, partial [Vicinamibacterales bacterium]|nr:hypothetical protein [Vicinamibacterales bacterium]
MTSVRAAWACPIDQPPIRDAIIEIEDGIIRSISSGSRLPSGYRDLPPGSRDLGNVAILPGLINAHTHLELSWLRNRVPPAARFTDWVKTLFAIRGRPDRGMSAAQIAPIHEAIAQVRASGTVAVGDIANSLAAVGPMR